VNGFSSAVPQTLRVAASASRRADGSMLLGQAIVRNQWAVKRRAMASLAALSASAGTIPLPCSSAWPKPSQEAVTLTLADCCLTASLWLVGESVSQPNIRRVGCAGFIVVTHWQPDPSELRTITAPPGRAMRSKAVPRYSGASGDTVKPYGPEEPAPAGSG
jgi:hypothetical protein